jgi:hypothetical protein
VAYFRSNNGLLKKVHFGYRGADDYTITHNIDQRERYRARHHKDLASGDPTRAGYLSYYILWGNNININTNISDYKERFNL